MVRKNKATMWKRITASSETDVKSDVHFVWGHIPKKPDSELLNSDASQHNTLKCLFFLNSNCARLSVTTNFCQNIFRNILSTRCAESRFYMFSHWLMFSPLWLNKINIFKYLYILWGEVNNQQVWIIASSHWGNTPIDWLCVYHTEARKTL